MKVKVNHIVVGVLILFLTTIASCRRDEYYKQSPTDPGTGILSGESVQKINTWLESHKSANSPNKSENLMLMESNLDFPSASIESRNENDDLITIPVKDELLTRKGLDKNYLVNLLVVRSKSGRIRWGTVVCFLSADGKKPAALKKNTFQNIFNSKPVEQDGKYKFLSLTGRLMYVLEYKNHKLFSHGSLQTKSGNTQAGSPALKVNSDCTDWYLVTTYYYSDGSTEETWDYIGTTCNGCDDGMYMGFCPDGGGGGGGGGSSDDPVDQTYTTSVSDSSTEENYTDDDNGYMDDGTSLSGPSSPSYQLIAYTHYAEETRDGNTGMIEYVTMYNTTASPMSALYYDVNRVAVTRTLTLLGHFNTYSITGGGFAVSLSWSCDVNGRYIYSDGRVSTQQWHHSHTIIR
jgi:hypothetical protein